MALDDGIKALVAQIGADMKLRPRAVFVDSLEDYGTTAVPALPADSLVIVRGA